MARIWLGWKGRMKPPLSRFVSEGLSIAAPFPGGLFSRAFAPGFGTQFFPVGSPGPSAGRCSPVSESQINLNDADENSNPGLATRIYGILRSGGKKHPTDDQGRLIPPARH